MLRAHMPVMFRTPGTAQISTGTGDKILVLDEDTRRKLMAANRERIMRCRIPLMPWRPAKPMCNVAQTILRRTSMGCSSAAPTRPSAIDPARAARSPAQGMLRVRPLAAMPEIA
jgi:hypothetical protein